MQTRFKCSENNISKIKEKWNKVHRLNVIAHK